MGSYFAGLVFTDNDPRLWERGCSLLKRCVRIRFTVGVVGCGVDLRLNGLPRKRVSTPPRRRNSLIILTPVEFVEAAEFC